MTRTGQLVQESADVNQSGVPVRIVRRLRKDPCLEPRTPLAECLDFLDAQQHERSRQGVGDCRGRDARPLRVRLDPAASGRGTAAQAATRPRTGSPVRGSTM